jgi:hypothetical protein
MNISSLTWATTPTAMCAYHGQRAIASKAYVARRHLAMPASTDYWINDRSGDPLLVVTGEVDAALTKALPRLLREVRDLVRERRVTIVFDRGGWSPKLFDTMIKDGFDLLTYRKGRCRRINERRFIARHAEFDGCRVDYLLHDQPVRFLKGKLRLRQVTRLCDDGHQTQVITSRWDLRDIVSLRRSLRVVFFGAISGKYRPLMTVNQMKWITFDHRTAFRV